jgi:hypothetical protein
LGEASRIGQEKSQKEFMSRSLIHLLGFLMLWFYAPGSARAQDLSGTVWIFSMGNPPQPFPDNTWKIVAGAPGSPLSVLIQRGMGEAAQLHGSYKGKKLVVQVDQRQSRGVYRGSLSEDGTKIEGFYSESRDGAEVEQPFRLTRLDSLTSIETIQISWQQSPNDPEAVVCKASLPSGQRLNFSWSLDGQMQPAMTSEVRLTRVKPGSHRITAIGFDSQSQFLTAPQTITFVKKAPRSWDLPLLVVALALLGLAGLGWGRKKWVKSVEVEVGSDPGGQKSFLGRSSAKTARDESVLPVRGDGRDETLVQFRGILAQDVELRAPDPSPRLLLKKVEAGVMVRAVYLGARPAQARLELHRGKEVSPIKVAVEPILLELQLAFEKRGFAPRSYTTRVGGLCGAVGGRVVSSGEPVAYASCQACMRIDGGEWSNPVSGQSDGEGFFRFEMPPLFVQVLGVELAEFRLEKMDLPGQGSEPLETLCAARPPGAGTVKAKVVLQLPPEAEDWLNSLAEWVGKVGSAPQG